jgi:hypothetical protein
MQNKRRLIAFSFIVGFLTLNQIIGDHFPFSDLPMFGALKPYAEYYYISNEKREPIPLKKIEFTSTNELKKKMMTGLKQHGIYQFERFSLKDIFKKNFWHRFKSRFQRAYSKRENQLFQNIVPSEEVIIGKKVLKSYWKRYPYKEQFKTKKLILNRVAIKIIKNKVSKIEIPITEIDI